MFPLLPLGGPLCRVQGGLSGTPASPGLLKTGSDVRERWLNRKCRDSAASGPLSQPSPVPPAPVWIVAEALSTSDQEQPHPGHLALQTSCLQPGTFSPTALSWEEVCAAWAGGSRSVVWHLCLGEVREQRPYWRAREGDGEWDRASLRQADSNPWGS